MGGETYQVLDFHRGREDARTHARTCTYAHVARPVAAHVARPVAVLTNPRRYSVCAIEISFSPDARKVGARN